MKKLVTLAALMASLALVHAQSEFTVTLNGANERPTPNNSPATGSGILTLNPNNSLFYDITFGGLTGNFTASHIHGPATREQAAGVIFGLNDMLNPDMRSGRWDLSIRSSKELL